MMRICLSQKATVWQKIKWLFTNGVKIVQVDELDNNNNKKEDGCNYRL